MRIPFVPAIFLFVTAASCAAQTSALQTPVTAEQLDASTYAQWVDGSAHTITPADAKDNARSPQWIVWTNRSNPGHAGIAFGASKTPGPRHLRIGLKSPATVGAVLVRGGTLVSVLKENAAYPGDPGDDNQWIPAQRLHNAQVSVDQAGRENCILWTLPRAVPTRAIRLTHVAQITDKDYAGWVGGIYVLTERVANLAPQATVIVSSNDKQTHRLTNENHDVWDQWCNIPKKEGQRASVVSPQQPEWIMLTWTAPVQLSGLGFVFAGFGDGDAQIFDGPADLHPREAPDSAWKTIKTVTGVKNLYPLALPSAWMEFDASVSTRALRLRLTRATKDGGHPHTNGHTVEGKRVWLGELLALSPLGNSHLKTAILPPPQAKEQPPIAVKFSIPEPGWVTLVIEDTAGKRIRNLIAETYFEKGEHTAWWDGSDDLERDPTAAKHGLYYIPTQLVAPGAYRVRGLWRKAVNVKFEFGVYNAGKVPWETADRAGGWLANHSAPSAVLFVPQIPTPEGLRKGMLIGSYVSEGTAGLAWVAENGVKWKGQGWVGGNWTGAPHLARDAGPNAIPTHYAYVAAAWDANSDKKATDKKGEIRITALTAKEDKPVGKYTFTPTLRDNGNVSWEQQIGGVAVHNGLIVVSLSAINQLLWIDANTGNSLAQTPLPTPRGLAFDAAGRLLVISANHVVAYAAGADPKKLPEPALVADDLDQPHGLTLDTQSNLYVSQRGQSHQVKVFSPTGKLLRTIGKPGVPAAGPYEPLHMNNPRGLAIDSQNRLWVAEEDDQPKRISVWNPDATLASAYYGPAEYGGGGAIDPTDKSKFYYLGMEFKLDWTNGTDQVTSVFYRHNKEPLKLAFRAGMPQTPLYIKGTRYWHNAYNSSPTGGHGTVFIFADRNGLAVPVAAAGRANDWDILKSEPMAKAWPEGTDPKANAHTKKAAFFIWSDLNADGQVQLDEVKLTQGTSGGMTVMSDLALVAARLDGKAIRFAPVSFTSAGVPIYNITKPQTLADGTQPSPSSGGDQALALADGWTIHTTAPKPYKGSAIGGSKDGNPVWSYPSLWPGLHASHESPVPDRPGMIIGHTRLLGDIITPGKNSERLFLINGNHGPVYAFTPDGLFVAQIFHDMRLGRPWHMPASMRGMDLSQMTPSDENFWPSVTCTPDGAVYLFAGRPNCLVRVEGLDTVQRIAPTTLQVTADDLHRAREYFVKLEAARQAAAGRGVLNVAIRTTPPTVDGKLDDWSTAFWADIDKRGTAAYFNSKSGAYDVTGAVAVAGDRLYAAWRTNDKDLLKNAGDVPNALFKTGGALDLMIGANASADPKRTAPVNGDLRLLVTQVAGKTRALLYRPVADNKNPVPFSSPWRTITFDRVDDVSDKVQLAATDGNFELSIPLADLGLKPAPALTLRGDIGILRGTGATTTQRVYWSNKATAIVADVPSEAELRPALWGRWEFTGQ